MPKDNYLALIDRDIARSKREQKARDEEYERYHNDRLKSLRWAKRKTVVTLRLEEAEKLPVYHGDIGAFHLGCVFPCLVVYDGKVRFVRRKWFGTYPACQHADVIIRVKAIRGKVGVQRR